jgi:hypothetical protein
MEADSKGSAMTVHANDNVSVEAVREKLGLAMVAAIRHKIALFEQQLRENGVDHDAIQNAIDERIAAIRATLRRELH